jgi:hypothetical protein
VSVETEQLSMEEELCKSFVLQRGYGHLQSKVEYKYVLEEQWGHAVAHLVEVLLYKPEGGGFDSRWCHWNFSLT